MAIVQRCARVNRDTRVTVPLYNCIQDTRYFIFQIRAPGGHDTTFIISIYTINNYYVCRVYIICVFLFVSTSHFDSMYCKHGWKSAQAEQLVLQRNS